MPKPSSSFPSAFHRIFETGLKKDLDLFFEDEGKAASFRHQLHSFRRALRDESSPLYDRYNQVVIRLNSTKLTLENRNRELAHILSQIPEDEASISDKALDEYLSKVRENESGKES